MDNEKLIKLLYSLETAKYKFAKTMPKFPHSYTLKSYWKNSKEFESVVDFIKQNGIEENFFKKKYIYYYTENYKYWTMGDTTRINKQRKNKMSYHSALTPELKNLQEVDFYKIKNSIAFYYNITDHFGLPKEYNNCDVLYTELAWMKGLNNFNKRANIKSHYNKYILSINNIIRTNKIPIIIVTGINDSKKLLPPNMCLYTKLNGAKAMANVYNFKYNIKYDYNDTNIIIKNLSKKFNCVGDFCCGYGNTGNIFYKNNKDFIMSDYNKKCIGFIKKNINENI